MVNKLKFRPHPLFRGGHLQTLAGFYWPDSLPAYRAEPSFVQLSDGDSIALHDDCPADWKRTDQVALLLHGLAGCHRSAYMVRLAKRLNDFGVRTFRMDMRGTGAATGHAQLPGHAGRTEDAAAAICRIAELCPDAPLTIVGYSMGGNIALGTLANASREPIGNLQRGIAVSPPVDLSKCCRELRTGLGNFYDKFLIRHLLQRWQATGGTLPSSQPKSIYEFDDKVTAPLSGFRDAEDYYANASSGPRLKDITLPTRILAAKDDPVVAYGAIEAAERSDFVELHTARSGGHLGFFGSGDVASEHDESAINSKASEGSRRMGYRSLDYRWMDRVVASWVACDFDDAN